MSRQYRAARRSAEGAPIGFDYTYDERVRSEAGGEEYRERMRHFDCGGSVSTLLLSKLAQNSTVDTTDPEGIALIAELFEQAFGVPHVELLDEDGVPRTDADGYPVMVVDKDSAEWRQYDAFFKLHTRYGDDDLMMNIIQGLVEDFSARPTQPVSPSRSGPSQSGATSKVVSLSRGTVEVVPGETVAREAEAAEEQVAEQA